MLVLTSTTGAPEFISPSSILRVRAVQLDPQGNFVTEVMLIGPVLVRVKERPEEVAMLRDRELVIEHTRVVACLDYIDAAAEADAQGEPVGAEPEDDAHDPALDGNRTDRDRLN